MKRTNLTDFDLDVMNVMKDFPSNESDTFMYARGDISGSEVPGFFHARGSAQCMSHMIISMMESGALMRYSVLDAVLNYLSNNEDEKNKFASFINGI